MSVNGASGAGARGHDTPPAWWVFHGTGIPHDSARMPEPPPWREYGGGPALPDPPAERGDRRILGALPPVPGTGPGPGSERGDFLDKVNAALILRRPLLLTGPPGIGKSTLAYQIARELGLGRVLVWGVNSSSTVRSSLYSYDPISQIHDLNLENTLRRAEPSGGLSEQDVLRLSAERIGRYLALGPLGTAFLPYRRPRVLLVDDFDLGDFDLSGDLLHLFESGGYTVPELERLSPLTGDDPVTVGVDDPGRTAPVTRGRVVCSAFPVVVLTCNSDRELSPAFLRRTIPVRAVLPSEEELMRLVLHHFDFRGEDVPDVVPQLVGEFARRGTEGGLAIDQLLNAVRLVSTAAPGTGRLSPDRMQHLTGILWHHLTDRLG